MAEDMFSSVYGYGGRDHAHMHEINVTSFKAT